MAHEPTPQPDTDSVSARQQVLEAFNYAFERASLSPDDVTDDLNVIDKGLVDSIEFLDLVAGLEQRAGVELDLFDVDPDVLTTIGGLTDILSDALD